MFPPKVSDAQIRNLIVEMSTAGTLPSGVALRRVLTQRHGAPGGVRRIYALLSQAQVPKRSIDLPQAAPPSDEVQHLRQQLLLQQEREEADQSRWAQEIDRLRQKLMQLEPLAHQAQILRETAELLRHRLQAAELRCARLEESLMKATAEPTGTPSVQS